MKRTQYKVISDLDRYARLLCVFLSSTVFALISNPVQAQSPITWSQVIDLSRTTEPATQPVVASDPWGNVHVFWSQKQGGIKPATGQTPDSGNAIYHQVWNGQRWSGPIDIILGDPNDWFVVYPFATIDKNGMIYLIWAGRNNLYLSRAPAASAHNAISWERPRVIVRATGIDQSRLLIGPDNELYVVYSRVGRGLGGDGNVAFMRSDDLGVSWSTPQVLSLVPLDQDVASVKPRMALDHQSRLHVVWTETSAPDWIGRRILYVRSEDNGRTWSRPQTLAVSQGTQDWAEAPNLATTPDGKVHVVWTCGDVRRCYRFSDSGGKDWSTRQQLFGDLQSLAGWDDMVADQEGTLHLVAQLRMPFGIYYAYKPLKGGWSQPIQVVSQEPYSHGHFLQAALALGNQLHVVMQYEAKGDVWHIRITTGGSAHTPVPMPVVTPTLTIPPNRPTLIPAQTSVNEQSKRPTAIPRTVGDYESAQIERASPAQTLVLALLPVVFLILIVLGVRLGHR